MRHALRILAEREVLVFDLDGTLVDSGPDIRGTLDLALRDCGIARIGILDALLESRPLALRLPLRAPQAARPRVGIVTTTGGGAAMVVDQLGIRGLDAEPASAATLAAPNTCSASLSAMMKRSPGLAQGSNSSPVSMAVTS